MIRGVADSGLNNPLSHHEHVAADALVDVNVSLFHWPCRRLPFDDTPRLVSLLSKHSVTEAWAGSFDAILHHDVAGVNDRLFRECQIHGDGRLRPVGAVNLRLPDWEDDLRRCHEIYGMGGIRLLPGYHDYDLQIPSFQNLLQQAAEHNLFVQIAVRLEDPRTQHHRLIAKDVDLTPLASALADFPEVPVVLLNALSSANSELHAGLVSAGRVYFDLSTLEGLAGIERLLKSLPAERLIFGSHAPFFALESSLLKLQESEIPQTVRLQITSQNAGSICRLMH